MPLPFLPSIDEQKAAIDSAGEFTLTHTDTCLSCYVLDHMNGDNELLLSASVDGDTTYEEVKEELLRCLRDGMDDKPGYDDDKAQAAIAAWFADVPDMGRSFDNSLDRAPHDDEYDSDGALSDAQDAWEQAETCYAWFRLAWPAQEDAS